MISNRIDQEIKQAMLAKDQVTLRGLRAIKAAFLLAKTEKSGLEELTEQAEIKILQKLVKQRKESAGIYKNQGRDDLLRIEQEEIEVINKFLPDQLSHSDIEKAVEQIISQTDAVGIKDIGRVMGLANKDLAGRAESKLIGEIVKQKLASL